MIIYKATNLKNNKVYIGQTINSLEYRQNQHIKDCRRVNYYNNYFHNALIKYGISCWKWEVLEECNSIEQLNEREIYYIKFYDSTNKEKGYNLKFGGQNGVICYQETKDKIGLTTKLKWENPEIAQKMRSGLEKATQKWIEICKSKRVYRKCLTCGKEFETTPKSKKRFCNGKCATSFPEFVEKRNLGAIRLVEKRNSDFKLNNIPKIHEWIRLNKHVFDNIKWNNLKFLQDLCNYIEVKDHRTVAKILDCSYKKELVKKLINISKNIC